MKVSENSRSSFCERERRLCGCDALPRGCNVSTSKHACGLSSLKTIYRGIACGFLVRREAGEGGEDGISESPVAIRPARRCSRGRLCGPSSARRIAEPDPRTRPLQHQRGGFLSAALRVVLGGVQQSRRLQQLSQPDLERMERIDDVQDRKSV